jgi:hypothetical protein
MLNCDDYALIEELIKQRTGVSASPGFTWGRSGNIPDGGYLLHQSVPSNIASLPMPLAAGIITTIFFEQETSSTFDLVIFTRPSFAVVYQKTFTGTEAVYTIPVASRPIVTNTNRLGMQIVNGTAKNIIAGLLAVGTV